MRGEKKVREAFGTLRVATTSDARQLAKRLALSASQHWDREKDSVPGLVDVIDFFSGCGGVSAGFRIVNSALPIYRITGALDIDEVANDSYEQNFGARPEMRNVSVLARNSKSLDDFIASRTQRGRPLVMIGCAPCQGFSSHRNAEGEGDPRNSLVVDFARIVSKVKPDAVIIENVPELLTYRYWPVLQETRRILHRSGYFVNVAIHNMAHFGVPQERFRVVITAMRQEFGPLEGFITRKEYRTVRDAIGHLPPVTAGAKTANDPMHYSAGHSASTIATIRATPKDGGSRPMSAGPECLRRAALRNGKPVYEDVYGRLKWDAPAITITAYSRNPASGRFVHPDQDRGLTVREAALLQGFPATYSFSGSLDQRFRQIGNAVPPPFSTAMAVFIASQFAGLKGNQRFQEGVVEPVGASFSRMIPSLKLKEREG
jgi:DNA (cytosine-5)-methyltransferase 1